MSSEKSTTRDPSNHGSSDHDPSNQDPSNQELRDYELVLLGCGRMGSAIVTGLVESGRFDGEQLVCLDTRADAADALAKKLGGRRALDIGERPRIWLVAVKPGGVAEVLGAYAGRMSENDMVVSVAAGVRLAALRNAINAGMQGAVGSAGKRAAKKTTAAQPTVVRAMPNTPALVGRGVTGLMAEFGEVPGVVRSLFEGVGFVVALKDEAQFDGLTGLSGSGPAYIFVAIEALADAGVLMGLERSVARALAVHTVGGAAALVEADMDIHTAELKDRVASPGGTTIRGLAELEANGFRHALISAVRAASEQSRKMSDGD